MPYNTMGLLLVRRYVDHGILLKVQLALWGISSINKINGLKT